MRFLPAVVLAVLTNFLLFLLMHKMVAVGGQQMVRDKDYKGIDFIRVKRQAEPPKPKKRKIPRRSPPSKKAPPPEKMKMMALAKPKIARVQPHMRPIRNAMHISDGPYLGQFTPDPLATEDGMEDVGFIAPGIGLGEIETDVIPMVKISPRYPRRAVRSKIEGIVTIEFTITRDGSVVNPAVIQAAPPYVFDQAALRAIRRWKFRPKFVEGRPVQRRAVQNIRFSLQK
ncbi:MAG: energy transducer TonB [Nitrospiria bacterium]